jgi:hypothetical protein
MKSITVSRSVPLFRIRKSSRRWEKISGSSVAPSMRSTQGALWDELSEVRIKGSPITTIRQLTYRDDE